MKCFALLPLLMLLPLPADDTVVAKAKDTEFTRAQFGEWMVDRMGVQHLDLYVFCELVQRLAAERGLMPTEAEIEAAYEEEFLQVTDNGKPEDTEKFVNELKLRGYTVDAWKARRIRELRVELAQAAVARADRVVTEERLRARFKDLFGDLGERVNLEVFFFSAYHELDPADTSPDVAELKAVARARAEAALVKLKAGASREELLALSQPIASEFVRDGLITGYRRMMLGREVDKAVSSLDEPGDTSPLIDAFDGCYIVRMVAREPVRFEDAREELAAAVMSEAVDGSELAAVHELVMKTYAVEFVLH